MSLEENVASPPTAPDVFGTVQKIVADVMGCSVHDVTREARLEQDLGGDPLDLLDIVVECELKFDLAVMDDGDLKTIGDLVDAIENALKAEPA